MTTLEDLVIGDLGTATFTQNGGECVLAGSGLVVGNAAGSSGTYTLNSGGTCDVQHDVLIGGSGTATMQQNGGTCMMGGGLYLGAEPGAQASYVLASGASLSIGKSLTVGAKATGSGSQPGATFQQSGGDCTVGDDGTTVAFDGGSKGVYTMTGGALSTPLLAVGSSGDGKFLLGNATGTGQISAVQNLRVRYTDMAAGTFEGWGTVATESSSTLTNNGKVTANGYSTDRSLDLTGFGAVANPINNAVTANNGWFAVDHGKLLLPSVSVAGFGTYNWGEAPYVAVDNEQIDLTNSVQVSFPTETTPGTMSIALLAADRGDVATLPAGRTPIGIWHVALDGVTLWGRPATWKFRYDTSSSPDEATLGLMQCKKLPDNTWAWVDLAGTKDTTNNTIQADVGPFAETCFAVVLRDDAALAAWRWVGPGTTSPWQTAANWTKAPSMGAYPNDLTYPACIGSNTLVEINGITDARAGNLYLDTHGSGSAKVNIKSTGLLTVDNLWMGVQDWTGNGICILTDAASTLTVNHCAMVGQTGTGTLALTNGTCTIGSGLYLGSEPGSNGTLQIMKAAVQASSAGGFDLVVGGQGPGFLYMLDGTVQPIVTGLHNLTIRGTSKEDVSAIFRGQGTPTVASGGKLTNNGQVYANGWGISHHYTLDLSGFASVANTIDNIATYPEHDAAPQGWYAQSYGKLVLPALSVAGNTLYNWGEAPYGSGDGQDEDIDLVNSVQMQFGLEESANPPYSLTISLLATDRRVDVPYTSLPAGYTILGIWEFAFGSPTVDDYTLVSSADLTFRYNYYDPEFGDEDVLDLLRYNPTTSTWEIVSHAVDAQNHLISTTALATPLLDHKTYYAVGYLPPQERMSGAGSSATAGNEQVGPVVGATEYEPQWIQSLQDAGLLEAWQQSCAP